jgi:hypothetical protein
MQRITPINIEYNAWNGFIIEIIGIETNDIEGCLFGIGFGKSFLYVHILFMTVRIFDKTHNQ